MSSGCLNEYHLQFLKRVLDHKCRFLIIGGQARSIYEATITRDLDVWVDISNSNRPVLELTLTSWAADHRAHSSVDFSQRPLPLRPGVQIKFPDADALFLGADGTLKRIGPADCVDILMSVGSADFAEYYDRAEWRNVDGLHLPFLALTDLDTVSPAKPVN
jgi:hypothetical protein